MRLGNGSRVNHGRCGRTGRQDAGVPGEAFEVPADCDVVFAGEVEAGEELGAAVVREGGGGEGLEGG